MASDKPKLPKWGFLFPGGSPFIFSLLCIAVYAAIVVWVDDHFFPARQISEAAGGMYSGAVMGLLLVFRTNSAYDRWWEGRKLWGQLINDLRNLCIKCNNYVNTTADDKAQFGAKLKDFAHVLKDHLRIETINFGKGGNHEANVPVAIANAVFEDLTRWKKAGQLTEFEMLQMDRHARALMDICGACERIVKSPIAGSYKVIIAGALGLYFLLVPWLLAPTFEMWSVLIVCVSAFFLLGLEFLSEEVERPFGADPNDLPLESMCATIDSSVDQLLPPSSVTVEVQSVGQAAT